MIVWIGLILLITILLGLDLIILHKRGEVSTPRKAAIESVIWISIAFLFSLAIYWVFKLELTSNINQLTPSKAVVKYLTGYLIELSLSIDNLFVIAMIFASFKIPIKYQHRALFWGIIGAIFFRGIAIAAGIILLQKISWLTYVFGAFLLFTAFKMLVKDDVKEDSPSFFRKLLNKYFNISHTQNEDRFWIVENGMKMGTPLFAALIMIELTDIMFALDSIPAILAVTTDPFIVFSSNIFAVLGLRSLYFFLADMLERFKYIKYSVFAILVFVALKLIVIHFIKFPEWFSLSFISVSLLMGILVSLKKKTNSK